MAAPKLQECPAGPDGKWMVPGVCVLLAVAVFLVFGQTLGHRFVNYDDNTYVYENAVIQKGLTLEGFVLAFTRGYASNWHPLTMMSHMLDCRLYGLKAGGHHLTNVLLHTASGILLFLVLRQMTGFLWRSAFVAAVFAIHPLRVESVAWVAERKDVLSGLFFMLTLWAYVRYVRRPFSLSRYLSVVFLFTLGLLSKPMVVTLPFVLLLLDYWPLERVTDDQPSLRSFGPAGKWQVTGEKKGTPSALNPQLPGATKRSEGGSTLLLEKLPLLGLAVASCVVTIFVQHEVIQSSEKFSLPLRLGNASISYVVYLGQMFWPSGLAVLYPFAPGDVGVSKVVLSLVLLAGISGGVFVLRRRRPYLLTGWLWYLGMLVPVIGLIQVGLQARADRYTYLPQIGLYVLLTWAAADLCAGWRHRRLVLGGLATVILVGLIFCARAQTSYWRNSESLWTHTLAHTSGNYIAHNSLGIMLGKQGRLDEAIEHFQKALEIFPGYPECHNNLGVALLQKGQVDEAIEHFQKVLEIKPNDVSAHCNLGNALRAVGRIDEAIVHFKKALDNEPDDADTYYNLGVALVCIGRSDEAHGCFQKVIELKPDSVGAYNNLGLVLFTQGKFAEAIKEYRRTLELKPNYADAHFMLGCALRSQREFEAAKEQFQEVLKLEPGHEMAQNGLAWLLATCPEASLRDGNKAVELGQQAEQLAGDESPQILDTLAAAYAEAGRYPEAVEMAKRALNLTATQNNRPLAEAIQARLKLYEAGSPYHENP
ncbi:MAG: tetratricopeptide repeat protein [Verrucomicrobiota bacterium]|jgi:tetratricopeptide (TPR) repeat protein